MGEKGDGAYPVVLMVLATVASSCSSPERPNGLSDYEDTLKAPEKVVAHRITYDVNRKPIIGVGAYPVSDVLSQKLSSILWKPSTYRGGGKECATTPGVLITFYRNDVALDVKLCFECKVVEFEIDGEFFGSGSFDWAESKLIRIVQKIFPDDGVIQSL